MLQAARKKDGNVRQEAAHDDKKFSGDQAFAVDGSESQGGRGQCWNPGGKDNVKNVATTTSFSAMATTTMKKCSCVSAKDIRSRSAQISYILNVEGRSIAPRSARTSKRW